MAQTLYDHIAADPRLSFLPPECEEVFSGCFDMRLLELAPGARFDTAGCVAYLLEGSGEIGAWDTDSGVFFGVSADGRPQRQTFTTHTSCLLLLWNDDVITRVCYRACWFHVKFLNMVRHDAAHRVYRIGE